MIYIQLAEYSPKAFCAASNQYLTFDPSSILAFREKQRRARQYVNIHLFTNTSVSSAVEERSAPTIRSSPVETYRRAFRCISMCLHDGVLRNGLSWQTPMRPRRWGSCRRGQTSCAVSTSPRVSTRWLLTQRATLSGRRQSCFGSISVVLVWFTFLPAAVTTLFSSRCTTAASSVQT